MNVDPRGSFTELVKSANVGQVSINISKPGITKGEHWHNTKWEFFIVVAGHGKIQQRKLGTDEIIEFEVSGDKIEAVHMLPGYTHNIINLSDTEDLVTVMYCNECFDSNRPTHSGRRYAILFKQEFIQYHKVCISNNDNATSLFTICMCKQPF